MFLDYSSNSKGYRCYDPVARCFYTSMDVTFLKDVHFFTSPNHSSTSIPQETTSIHDQGELPHPTPAFDTSSPVVPLPLVITPSPAFHYSQRSQAHASPPTAS